MENTKTSTFNHALIWFGAGVSIAEIITGTYFAPLGFAKGTCAVLLGHLIGCILLFFAGYIGGLSGKSSMETTKFSFGDLGGRFFAILNVLQLAGWTGIMIYDGAQSLNGIVNIHFWPWALVIGALIIVWIVLGITNLGKFNTITMTALFVLTLIMCEIVFRSKNTLSALSLSEEEGISFGAAVELAVAMPLSWLPLISDYTKDAKKPLAASLVSSSVYGAVSCWMYIIGMGLAILTGEGDIASIMVKTGLGFTALIIIILSTVTTTFLDAFSAGISAETIWSKLKGKWTAVGVAVIGTIGAILFNMDNITDFLYLIGSVFAPMIAILFADFFVVKTDYSDKKLSIANMIIWVIGFVIYRLLMNVDIVIGNTLPDMIISFVIAVAVGLIIKKINQKKSVANS